jgi:hypothetical protein
MSAQLKKYAVYMEPELWKLCRNVSLAKGCKSHPESGSASEGARRMLKKGMLIDTPNLINVQRDKIEWAEKYD